MREKKKSKRIEDCRKRAGNERWPWKPHIELPIRRIDLMRRLFLLFNLILKFNFPFLNFFENSRYFYNFNYSFTFHSLFFFFLSFLSTKSSPRPSCCAFVRSYCWLLSHAPACASISADSVLPQYNLVVLLYLKWLLLLSKTKVTW